MKEPGSSTGGDENCTVLRPAGVVAVHGGCGVADGRTGVGAGVASGAIRDRSHCDSPTGSSSCCPVVCPGVDGRAGVPPALCTDGLALEDALRWSEAVASRNEANAAGAGEGGSSHWRVEWPPQASAREEMTDCVSGHRYHPGTDSTRSGSRGRECLRGSLTHHILANSSLAAGSEMPNSAASCIPAARLLRTSISPVQRPRLCSMIPV